MLDRLLLATTEFFLGDAARIQHFYKVHAYSALIGRKEELAPDVQATLEAAAVVHDVGIRIAEQKYGYQNGKLQEELGPDAARSLMTSCGYSEETVSRACWLVGHHHTYTDISSPDYQILVEADFLVNLFEGGSHPEAIEKAYREIFRTETGKRLCRTMFGLPDDF